MHSGVTKSTSYSGESDSSVFSDDYHTPNLTPNTSFEMVRSKRSREANEENELLGVIAANMKHATEDEINQMMESRANKRAKEAKTPTDQQMQEVEMEQSTNAQGDDVNIPDPQAISFTNVIEMFRQLKEEMKNELKTETGALKTDLQSSNVSKEAMDSITEDVQANKDQITALKKEVEFHKHCTVILTEVCDRFSTEIAEIQTRLDNVELNSSKKMVIITGLFVISEKKVDLIDEVSEFINDNMGLEITIDDLFTLGRNEPKPIVISLQFLQEKRLLLQNKAILKEAGQSRVFINDYVPAMTQEKRKREKEIISMAKEVDAEYNRSTNITYPKGKLTINGQMYKQKVVPPTPKELVDIDIDLLNKLSKIKLKKSVELTQDGSKFLTYSYSPVSSHQEIRDLYKKVKIIEPSARHIPCAYWIQGAETYYSQSFHDDSEPGSGRVLLENLLKFGEEGTVLFGVRRYGGVKLGTDRFDLYAKTAIDILGGDPQQHVTRSYAARKAAMRSPRQNRQSMQQQTQYPERTPLADLSQTQQPQVQSQLQQHMQPQYHQQFKQHDPNSQAKQTQSQPQQQMQSQHQQQFQQMEQSGQMEHKTQQMQQNMQRMSARQPYFRSRQNYRHFNQRPARVNAHYSTRNRGGRGTLRKQYVSTQARKAGR